MANANADHNVSNRESHATRFEINRMPVTPRYVFRMYNETRAECNECKVFVHSIYLSSPASSLADLTVAFQC